MSNNTKSPRIGFYVCHCGHNIASVVLSKKIMTNFENTVTRIFVFIMLMLSIPFDDIFSETIRVPVDYPTIQQAVDSSSAGDTIFIDVGYYEENIQIDHKLSLIGKNRDSVIIEGHQPYPLWTTILLLSDSISIENLSIYAPPPVINWNGFSAIKSEYSSYTKISNVNLIGANGSGGHGTNGGDGGHAIELIKSTNIIIDSCTLIGGDGGPPDFTYEYGNGGYGLFADSNFNITLEHCSLQGGIGYYGGHGLYADNKSMVNIKNSLSQGGNGNYGGHGLGAYRYSNISVNISQLNGGLGNTPGLPYYHDSTSSVILNIKENENDFFKNFILYPNFPNPFNPSTVISFQLPVSSFVELKIFNVLGQEVKTLIRKYQTAGFYSINWDGLDNQGRQVSSGVYIYTLKTPSGIRTNKMTLVK